jgi:inner membrane protein involved in colicin E2 resistance
LSERLGRRTEAVADITSSWGREQNVIGPTLGIPYQYKFKTVKEVPAPDGEVERRQQKSSRNWQLFASNNANPQRIRS